MMTFKRCKTLLLATLAASTLLSGGDALALSLNEGLALAYQNNPNLKAAREDLHATNESLSQAYSGWLPSLFASYERSRENEKRGAGAQEQNTPHSRSLTLSQQIFNGGETMAQIGRAQEQINAGRERLKRIEQQTLAATVSTYMEVVRAKEVLKLSTNNEKVLGEQLDAAQQRFKLGEATKTDVAQAESRLARGKSDRIDAEGALISAKAGLLRVLGADMTITDAIATPAQRPILPKTLDEALDIALKFNPTLREAQFSRQVAQKDISITKARILPDVSVVGDVSREEHLSTSTGSSAESESVALRVSVPLYQSGAEYSRVRQAKKTAWSAEEQVQDIRNATIENVTKAWEDVQTSRAIILSRKAAVEAANTALDGVREEREVGSRTTLDVLDAEQESFIAQVNLVSAERDEVIASYNLLSTTGQLTAKSLGLDVALYDPDAELSKVKYKLIGY